jgi:hypothetical protein
MSRALVVKRNITEKLARQKVLQLGCEKNFLIAALFENSRASRFNGYSALTGSQAKGFLNS